MKNSHRVESPEGVDLIPSRDGRIRTGDFLLPIQVQVEANPGKNTCKPLVGGTSFYASVYGSPP